MCERGKQKKMKKDTKQFSNFYNLQIVDILKKNPTLKSLEIFRIVRDKWKTMSKREKLKYNNINDDRYKRKKNPTAFIVYINDIFISLEYSNVEINWTYEQAQCEWKKMDILDRQPYVLFSKYIRSYYYALDEKK